MERISKENTIKSSRKELDNLEELKAYVTSLNLGINNMHLIGDEYGQEYIVFSCNNGHEYERINITGSSKFGVFLDVSNFLRRHF